MDQRKIITITDSAGLSHALAYYDTGGEDPCVLLLHGFAEHSATWDEMLKYMPDTFRYIGLDLKGFGYSSRNDPDHLALFDQAECTAEFIRQMELEHLVLVGHSMGGAVSCLLLNYTDIRDRVDKLVLIDAAGMFTEVPEFISSLALISPQNPLLRFASEDLIIYLVLSQCYYREELIRQELVYAYAEAMRIPGAKECVIAAARNFQIPNVPDFQNKLRKQSLPVLILWGDHDNIIPVEDAAKFQQCLCNSRVEILPDCGHSPQEEAPQETARFIAEFLENRELHTPLPPEERGGQRDGQRGGEPPAGQGERHTLSARSMDQIRQLTGTYKLKMTRLVDRWSPGTIFLLVFIKILQLLKKFGMRAEENGWRKASGIFLRNEYSKFVLSCFRLTYYREAAVPGDYAAARKLLIANLGEYISENHQFHWSASPRLFRLGRRKVHFTDIAEAFYDRSGELLWVEVSFDPSRESFRLLTPDQLRDALRRLVFNVNKLRSTENRNRNKQLAARMRRWARRVPGYTYGARQELRNLVERLLTATYIHCELLPEEPERQLACRLASPNLRKYRNPGWGLLNIIARFTPDFSEVDLWMQYHHVPVDGMPMQELLADLKTSWGCRGVLPYPALDTPAARTEILYAGNRLFRNRFFVNFEPMLAVRREINRSYAVQMEGPVTVAGMVIWGLAQHRFFRNIKMLFPVDSEPQSGNQAERELSLVFIRAGKYIDPRDPLGGFLRFQKEFNRRLWHTRNGSSESYELLELYSMIHPLFYQIGLRFMPESMGEFVGSMGLSILRDADIFISPLSDLQVNGFMAIGDLTHPTLDGGTAGAVSSCGTRDQIRFFEEAVTFMAAHYRTFLEAH